MYKEMLIDAKAKGLTSETMMWESVEDIEDILCEIKDKNPAKYWSFMRATHGKLYKGHYSEDFAMHDVRCLKYTDKNGAKKEGGYWTIEQVEEATKKYQFPTGVNKYDRYVAANVSYADLCKKFDDAQILDAMYLMYFADEDYNDTSIKIWDYMCMVWQKKK